MTPVTNNYNDVYCIRDQCVTLGQITNGPLLMRLASNAGIISTSGSVGKC